MKNLKRALSLVLSAAMMVGMMVVGTGATVLPDVDNKDHDTAIGYVKALGVMEGDENGNFNPDDVVTRNEMAVVMANLAGLKLNGAHPFTDVPNWADDFVGALYTNGLTAGTSATTYGGAADITTTEAALMIMKTLGYFEYQGEFGDDWALATVKRGSELNLFKDIDAGVKDGLNRSELAQMIYNALWLNTVTVYEKGGMSVEGNGITVNQKAEYEIKKNNTILFNKLFDSAVDVDPTIDVLGRPGFDYSYTADGEETVTATIYAAADKTLVADEATTIAELLDDAKLKYDNVDDFDAEIGAGYVVELFVNEDDVKVLDKVVVYYFEAVEIEKVEEADEDMYVDEIADGAKYVVTTVDGDEYLDIELKGFNAKTFVDGAYMVVAYSVTRGDYAVEYAVEIGENEYDVIHGVTVAKQITGKATTVKAGEFATVDGEKVVFATEAGIEMTAGTEYDVYVDANGFVLAVAEVESKAVIDDIYVVDKIWSKDAKNEYNETVTTWYAQLVDMSGVASIVTLEKFVKNTTTAYDASWTNALVTISDKKWTVGEGEAAQTFKAGNDKFDLAVWTEADYGEDWDVANVDMTLSLEKDDTRVAIGNKTYRLNADTQYLLIGDSASDLVVEAKTGGIAVTDLAANVYVICADDTTTVSYMIIIAAEEIEEDAAYSKDVIFIKGASTEAGDGFIAQTVYFADGSSKVLNIADDQDIFRGFFAYTVNEDGFYEIDEADALVLNGVWEDEEGVIVNAVITSEDALYEGLLTVGSKEDIKVADAKFVDAHDKTNDAQYDKSVSNLTKVMDLIEKGAITSATLSMNVSEDGAVIVIVTELTK